MTTLPKHARTRTREYMLRERISRWFFGRWSDRVVNERLDEDDARHAAIRAEHRAAS